MASDLLNGLLVATLAMTNMARRCGRHRYGQRLHCGIPHSHYKALTFVCGLLRGVDFTKLKAFLRKPSARTVAGLIATLEGCADL